MIDLDDNLKVYNTDKTIIPKQMFIIQGVTQAANQHNLAERMLFKDENNQVIKFIEINRTGTVRIQENKLNLEILISQSLSNMILWDESSIISNEEKLRHSKLKEAAFMSITEDPISQCLSISKTSGL